MKTTVNKQKSTKKQKKEKYRINNWSAYNKSLIKRGSINLWIPSDIADWWYGNGKNTYSDRAIETMLTIKAVYKLPLRGTTGFVQSLFAQVGITLSTPDYSTISRRAQKLHVVIKRSLKDTTDIILDSTGVKVYGEGEWKVRKHGWSYRRTWKKIHLAIDSRGEIRAVVVTDSDTHDSVPVRQILEQETAQISDFYGDGAFDTIGTYSQLQTRKVTGYHIPPRHDAKIKFHGNLQKPPYPRDENLRAIRNSTRKKWKQESGYHTRSLIETTMYRYKTLFGQQLSFRTDNNQRAEVMVKCNILNTFTHLCVLDSYKVP